MYRKAILKQAKLLNKDSNTVTNYDLMYNHLFIIKKSANATVEQPQVVTIPEYHEIISFVKQTSDVNYVVNGEPDKRLYSSVKYSFTNNNVNSAISLLLPKFKDLVDLWNVKPDLVQSNEAFFSVTLGPLSTTQLNILILHDLSNPKIIYNFNE
jgi:hypothetical protein